MDSPDGLWSICLTQLRDFGVIVDSSLTTSTQYAAAIKKVKKVLGVTEKKIENKHYFVTVKIHGVPTSWKLHAFLGFTPQKKM